MKHVRMPKFFFWIFAVCGALFGALAALITIQDSLRDASLMVMFAIGCLAVLWVLRHCELEYNEEVVRCRRLIGWRKIRIDEIDRIKRGQWATIFYAGKRRFRFDDWADDDGDLKGLILRICERGGRKLTVRQGGFAAFTERLYAGRLETPGEIFLVQIVIAAYVPLMLIYLIVSTPNVLTQPVVFAIFGGIELAMLALDGLMLYVIRHADRHPRLARLVVKDWAWRQPPRGKMRRKCR